MSERGSLWLRAGLLYAALVNASVGVWASVSPRGFYDEFPGLGRVWVAVDGPYNEHLVRDVGAWALALMVLCIAAAWTLSRVTVIAAGVALAVQSAPHLLYHVRHTEPYGDGDLVASLGGIAAVLVVGVLIAVAGVRLPSATARDTVAVRGPG
jgi:hypothetical protein